MMQQLQYQRHHQLLLCPSDKVAKSSNVNPMKKKSSPEKLRERLSNMRHGLTQKAKQVTERLSPKSSGKKGTTSGANNNGQKKSSQIGVQNNGNGKDKDTHVMQDLLNQEESSHTQKGKKQRKPKEVPPPKIFT